MAIDPTIALKAGQVPQGGGLSAGIERGMKLQQLALQPAVLQQQIATARQAELASAAATRETEARLPGVQAQAAGLVRTERQANERIAAAQAALETTPDGIPVIDPQTGQPRFNLQKYQYGLYKAGLVDEATKTGAEMLKQSKDVYDFAANTRTQVAIAAQAAYDKTVGTPAQKQAAAEATWRDMSQRAIAAAQQGGFPISEDQLRYTPGLERALYTASINPATQEQIRLNQAQQDLQRDQLNLQTEQFENSKIANFTDDASMDPSSGISQRARDIVFNTLGENIPNTVSAGELHRNPKYQTALTAVGNNVGAARNVALAGVSKYESVSKAIDRAQAKLAASGLRPTQFLENAVRLRLLDDPDLAALYAQLSQIDPKMITPAMGFDSLRAVADAAAAHAKANAGIAVGGGAPGRTAPAPGAPAAPGAQPQTGFVKGKIYTDAQGNKARYTGDAKNPWEEVK